MLVKQCVGFSKETKKLRTFYTDIYEVEREENMEKIISRINYQLRNNVKVMEMPFRKQWLVYLPVIVLDIFIGISYISYLICPFEWPFRYNIRTGIFILLTVLALTGGYLYSVRKKFINVTVIEINLDFFYNKLLLIGALLYIPTSYYKTGSAFSTIISSLIDPGKQYHEIIWAISNRPWYYNIIGCFYIVTYAVIILTYYYWDTLKKRQRFFGAIIAFMYMLVEISTGKSIGIIMLGVSMSVCFFSKICGKKLKGRDAIAYLVSTLFIIGLMIFMFEYNLKSRTRYTVENEVVYRQNLAVANEKIENEKTENEDPPIESYSVDEKETIDQTYNTYKLYENIYKLNLEKSADEYLIDYVNQAYTVSDYYRMPDALVYVHLDNKIYQHIPDRLKFLYVMGTAYLSNGYHGLSQALYLPFDSCFGLGHLKVIQYYLDKLFQIANNVPSYENKLIDLGWPVGLRWETAFTQFASDYSFSGTIILMIVMGWLLGKLWLEMVAGGNFITVLLFSFYCVQFFLITSWWYAGLTGGFFITFYLPLFCWIWQRIVLHKNIK